ncbi:MAG: hypothetical protein HYY49_09905, partial [Ignavibacteriales bacterium]|nr:hypothetical protein [Ignavibacteriales bacterium]
MNRFTILFATLPLLFGVSQWSLSQEPEEIQFLIIEALTKNPEIAADVAGRLARRADRRG